MAFILDGTTGIATVDGSVSAPSQRGQDSNSGISYGADSIKFSTNGVERLAISNSGLTGDGSGLTGIAGGGKLLKQDYAVLTSEFSTTSTSYVDITNLNFNFTPSAAGSKIWLVATPQIACVTKIQTADGYAAIRRGTTVLFETKEWSYTFGTGNYRTAVSRPFVMQYIDTPTYNLGDSIYYTLSLKQVNSGIRANWNSTGTSNFVIWEIAA